MKIDKNSQGGVTTVRLVGHFQAEHIGELRNQLKHDGPRFVLDLKELTLVDADVVRFLGTCEVDGITVVNCSPYIREWIERERKE